MADDVSGVPGVDAASAFGPASAAVAVSGRVIAAMNVLPLELCTTIPSPIPDSDPVAAAALLREQLPLSVRARRGNSALSSAHAYLATATPWDAVLVAWTGEIDGYDERATVLTNTQFVRGADSPPALEDIDTPPAPSATDFALSPADHARANSLLVDEAAAVGLAVEPIFLFGGSTARWRSYPEQVLWPLLHYIMGTPSDGVQEKAWWLDYVRFNEAFADRICSIYRPGDVIWVHDYHLLLLPQILRQRLPKAYIGFFLHAPFPSSEYFRYLTKRKPLLEGILGANMVAFQSVSYARHFISSTTRVLGFESTPVSVDAFGCRVAVEVFPVGIDADRVTREMDTQAVHANMLAIRELYPGKQIIVGRDRLDSVRGVVQKLRAFEMFLQLYPELAEKVVLIQLTAPAYAQSAKIERKVSEIIAHINGTYGMLHFMPVQHYSQQISRDEYYALLRVADLGLITSVRDGMNTTSLEFVVCQRDSHSPVILSEFTGTASSLADSITVNPWDSVGVAKTIHDCLLMTADEKATLHAKLYAHITTHTAQAWVRSFLARLLAVLASNDTSHMTPVLDRPMMHQKYNAASRRLFLFDYDGTLAPIVRDPAAAIPHRAVIDTLRVLASDSHNQVWIISGRDQAFLERYLGHIENLGLSAEHGCFMRPIGSREWVNLADAADMGWQKDVIDIFQYFTQRTQGSFIERKRAAVTWHYRRADPEYGAFQARECQNHLENTVTKKYDVEVMTGKANLEVRPRFVNKGEIVKRLVAEYVLPESSAHETPDFVLCMGDDSTDEDMFRALGKVDELDQESTFSVTIGPSSKMTTATWHLVDPYEVVRAVADLVGMADVAEEMGSTVVREEAPKLTAAAAAPPQRILLQS
ncbi:glycosyltransferase family 20-domain-containing protein [Limtongia smithiae]|uniref:glycosyltransferase family 20-domain-containing protein n=1 Tax=Limtongia smithiae TaxID=1125753 RepID=UPI0034CFFF7B